MCLLKAKKRQKKNNENACHNTQQSKGSNFVLGSERENDQPIGSARRWPCFCVGGKTTPVYRNVVCNSLLKFIIKVVFIDWTCSGCGRHFNWTVSECPHCRHQTTITTGGTQPTDTQQLKAEISELKEQVEWFRDNVDRGYGNNFINYIVRIQKLLAVEPAKLRKEYTKLDDSFILRELIRQLEEICISEEKI